MLLKALRLKYQKNTKSKYDHLDIKWQNNNIFLNE